MNVLVSESEKLIFGHHYIPFSFSIFNYNETKKFKMILYVTK